MTVTYTDKSFMALLFHWKGSVWKAVSRSYIIYLATFFAINLTYRYALTTDQQDVFEQVVKMLSKWARVIPIQFLLGFFVSSVVARWWDQVNSVAWPDKFLIFVTGNIQGDDEHRRLYRRTFARYCNLLAVLVWKEISVKIKKRFPTDRHLVKSGLMTEEEFKIYDNTSSTYGRWFVPVSWIVRLLAVCKAEGLITDVAHQKLLDEMYAYRGSSAMLTIYDWINIPLVYTQVVTIATYGYFAFCLICRQSLRSESKYRDDNLELDLIFPIFTTLEFVFYIGWLKVGEALRCPFGEDEEDIDMNYILDRNMHVANMLVDELHDQRPPIVKDRYWGRKFPTLPHTKASYKVKDKIPDWRLSNYKVPDNEQEVLENTIQKEEEENESCPVTVDTQANEKGGEAVPLTEIRYPKI